MASYVWSSVLVLATTAAVGQDVVRYEKPFTATSLSGVVLDAAGKPVENVKIELYDETRTNHLETALTNEKGEFTFHKARHMEQYRVYLTCSGFRPIDATVVLERVKVLHRRLIFRLSVAA